MIWIFWRKIVYSQRIPRNKSFSGSSHHPMQIQQIAEALEKIAPLPLQEGYDNAGLQTGITGNECSGALLCLDVTETVIQEAIERGFNLVIAHHPLLFKGVKCVSDRTQVERCLRMAIAHNITIYAAHTNLDNARGGVNYEIARHLGLEELCFLVPSPDGGGGSGLVGCLPHPVEARAFLQFLKDEFAVETLQYAPASQTHFRCIALCGGAGDFLIPDAISVGADCFLTGEIGYHHFFGRENEIWLAALGHYQSEQYTIQLFERILHEQFPALPVVPTTHNTNPICYL